MPELRRFGSHKSFLKAGIVLLAVVILGAVLLVAMSGGSEAEPAAGQSDFEAPSSSSSPSPQGSAGGPLHRHGSNNPSSAGARVTQPDPDQPVSSENPPAVTRPVSPPPDDGIDSFEDCARAGYPIAESYPEQCFTPDGRGFTRTIP